MRRRFCNRFLLFLLGDVMMDIDDAFSRSDLPGRKVGWFNQRWDGVEVSDGDDGDGDDVMWYSFCG